MVVDDNFVNLEFTAMLLKKYGFNSVTASSGRECLELLEVN
jgi:CheY-like chemotaxis protein